jgi:hypothetical protein
MSYDPYRIRSASPDDEAADTVPLRRGSLPGYYPMPSPLPYTPSYASESVYGLEKSPSVKHETKSKRRPFRLMGVRQAQHRHTWEESWDQAVKVGRWPRVIYAVVGVLFVIIWMVVMSVHHQIVLLSNFSLWANMDTLGMYSIGLRSIMKPRIWERRGNPLQRLRLMEG